MRSARDWNGASVGNLVVLRRIGSVVRKSETAKRALWECKCTRCGTVFAYDSSDLRRRERDKNVGCLRTPGTCINAAP